MKVKVRKIIKKATKFTSNKEMLKAIISPVNFQLGALLSTNGYITDAMKAKAITVIYERLGANEPIDFTKIVDHSPKN